MSNPKLGAPPSARPRGPAHRLLDVALVHARPRAAALTIAWQIRLFEHDVPVVIVDCLVALMPLFHLLEAAVPNSRLCPSPSDMHSLGLFHAVRKRFVLILDALALAFISAALIPSPP